MLMRSEGNEAVVDCDDPMTVIACTTDTAACPAACREADDTPVVVKAGDLAVSAKAAEGRRAIVSKSGAVSDLDTLTFRASEKVTISKVVLERYGYSSANDVDAIWLEDEDGNVIADEKSLSKDKVTLSIKKDYRDTDGTLRATVVARLTGENVGGTIGFKVVDVDSSAKNLNLDDYTPYTYDMVKYEGATVTVNVKWTAKDYNYTEWESYEIARLQVKAHDAIIYVKGFTLTNASGLELGEYLDKLTVKVDGKDVEGLKYSVNKDDQLVVSFDEMTIEMNKSALFVISASLEGLDEYNKAVAYYLDKESDINAVEKKTGARLTVDGTALDKDEAIAHAFKWGKIRLTNNKLGNLDGAQGAEGLLVAEWDITISEPISKLSFDVTSSNTGVAALRMFVNGEEYEAKKNGTTFSFSKVEIEKSGKIQFKIDIEDNDSVTGDITLTKNFGKEAFANAIYDNSREDVLSGDVSGVISFSKVTIQPANATFKNKITKAVEFMEDETTNDVVVFDGTYTAKKADITLNKFYMVAGATNFPASVTVTYDLYINDELVASTDAYGSADAYEMFSEDVKVKAGESVNVVVKATAEVYDTAEADRKAYSGFKVGLWGVDEFDKDVKEKEAKLVDMKIVSEGSVNLSAGSVAKTVLYKATKNRNLAQFTIKPSDGASSVEINKISFAMTQSGEQITTDDISVMFGDVDLEADNDESTTFEYSDLKLTLTSAKTVTVTLNEEKVGTYAISGVTVNGKKLSKEYVTRFEDAVVSVASQTKLGGGSTKVVFDLEKDDDVEVHNLVIKAGSITATLADVDDGSFVELINSGSSDVLIDEISYDVTSSDYVAGTPATCDSPYVLNTAEDACEASASALTAAFHEGAATDDPDTADVDETKPTCDSPYVLNTAEDACEASASALTAAFHEGAAASGGTSRPVQIKKADFNDFFLVDGTYARAYGNNNN